MVNIDPENSKIEIKNSKGVLKFEKPSNIHSQSFEINDYKIVYSGNKVQSTIEVIDGGIRQVINIESKNAPNFYDFPMNLENGQYISLNNDGSININNQKGEQVIFILKPWAKDSENKELKTWYEVIPNGIRQHVDFNNAIFPVVADPTWCGSAIQYVSWIKRGGQWSASNKPTWCGYWNCGGQWSCWQESYDKTPWCSLYSGNTCVHVAWNKQYNTNQYWSMYNQFMCHADIPKGTKPEWNLEPAKPDKGYWGFTNFTDQCN